MFYGLAVGISTVWVFCTFALGSDAVFREDPFGVADGSPWALYASIAVVLYVIAYFASGYCGKIIERVSLAVGLTLIGCAGSFLMLAQ